jgi:hypothetical protein
MLSVIALNVVAPFLLVAALVASFFLKARVVLSIWRNGAHPNEKRGVEKYSSGSQSLKNLFPSSLMFGANKLACL